MTKNICVYYTDLQKLQVLQKLGQQRTKIYFSTRLELAWSYGFQYAIQNTLTYLSVPSLTIFSEMLYSHCIPEQIPFLTETLWMLLLLSAVPPESITSPQYHAVEQHLGMKAAISSLCQLSCSLQSCMGNTAIHRCVEKAA